MTVIGAIGRFILLVALQVLVLNNIAFSGYLNPYVYILFLLYLPVSVSRINQLLLAFLLGFCIDMFENSGGVHIAATVLLAFSRNFLLRMASQRRGINFEDIRIARLPLGNLMLYSLLAIMLHHFTLFLIEDFRLSDLGTVLARTVISGIFTFVFVLLWQLWNVKRRD